MKFSQLFLSNLAKDQKEFLNLLDLTAKVHGETKPSLGGRDTPIWGEAFFHLENSKIWKSLPEDSKNKVLISLGHKILQEAYFIETAGMAYAARMNLAAKTKEERQFYCFVGEEEAKHLRMVEALANFDTSLNNIPSFALLIAEIIQEAKRPSHLLLIQILLEGWGLNYYKSLQKSAQDENVATVFKAILKDEIRHHSAGVILFNELKSKAGMNASDVEEFLNYIERISFMVKIGPWSVCDEVFRHIERPTQQMLSDFLKEIKADVNTSEKMEILEQLIVKALPDDILAMVKKKGYLDCLNHEEMTLALMQSISGTFELVSDR